MGVRIIKTALAVVVSIYIAQLAHLNSPLSAGLLAILGIEVTRKKGLYSALQRIGASVVGLFVASLWFHLFGFQIWVIGLFVLTVFPILNWANLREGAVTGSVVMFHLFLQQSVSISMLINEVQLLLVGLGSATVINMLYMPKEHPQLKACKLKAEQLFADIFVHIAAHLRDPSKVWDGAELLAAGDEVEKGRLLADKLLQNTFSLSASHWPIYFYMRGEQLESIQRMAALVAQVYETFPQGGELASVFEELSRDVKEDYYTGRSEARLRGLEATFKSMPLPATRGEFEVRSALLQLMLELHGYLSIAKKAKRQLPAAKVDVEG